MSRLRAFLLAFALLFQMSWAVAATYCEHETAPGTAMHFGHHAHVHKSADGKQHAASKLTVDDDCSDCHAGHAALVAAVRGCAAVAAAGPASFSQPSLHGSAPARAPDRPQWTRLA